MATHDLAYHIVTDRIIRLLEQGTVPWHRPWNAETGRPKNLSSGKPYRGVNVFMLGCQHYTAPWWLTFRQCKERGGSVRKGEKATPVVFWKVAEYPDEDDTTGEEHTRRRVVLRYYNVFNVEQCEGVEYPVAEPVQHDVQPIESCERLVAGMPEPPTIEHVRQQAFYSPMTDVINMPPRYLFESAEEYYSTLYHELVHNADTRIMPHRMKQTL